MGPNLNGYESGQKYSGVPCSVLELFCLFGIVPKFKNLSERTLLAETGQKTLGKVIFFFDFRNCIVLYKRICFWTVMLSDFKRV